MRRMFAFLSALCLLGSTAHGAEVVKVNMKDGDLGFKDITVKGEARFEVENSGTTEHGFELEGEIGGKKFEVASPVLAPGGKAARHAGACSISSLCTNRFLPAKGERLMSVRGVSRFAMTRSEASSISLKFAKAWS